MPVVHDADRHGITSLDATLDDLVARPAPAGYFPTTLPAAPSPSPIRMRSASTSSRPSNPPQVAISPPVASSGASCRRRATPSPAADDADALRRPPGHRRRRRRPLPGYPACGTGRARPDAALAIRPSAPEKGPVYCTPHWTRSSIRSVVFGLARPAGFAGAVAGCPSPMNISGRRGGEILSSSTTPTLKEVILSAQPQRAARLYFRQRCRRRYRCSGSSVVRLKPGNAPIHTNHDQRREARPSPATRFQSASGL